MKPYAGLSVEKKGNVLVNKLNSKHQDVNQLAAW